MILVRGDRVIEAREEPECREWFTYHRKPVRFDPRTTTSPDLLVEERFVEVFARGGSCPNCGGTMFNSQNFMQFPEWLCGIEFAAKRMPIYVNGPARPPNYQPATLADEVWQMMQTAWEYTERQIVKCRYGMPDSTVYTAFLAGAGWEICPKCAKPRKVGRECVVCRERAGVTRRAQHQEIG